MRTLTTPISHVVFIIQENRSFNNLFLGYPGATTQNYGYDTYGNKIPLRKPSISATVGHRATTRKLSSPLATAQGKLPGTKCKMDGWNNEDAGCGHPQKLAYAYVPEREIEASIGRWPSNTCSPIELSRRISTGASSRINTRSRPMPTAPLKSGRTRGAARAERTTRSPTLTKQRTYGSSGS